MRPKAFCLIQDYSREFLNPKWAFEAMRAYLESVIAHAKASSARDLMEKYWRNGIQFNDVESIVKSVEYKMKSENKKEKRIEDVKKYIMKLKLKTPGEF